MTFTKQLTNNTAKLLKENHYYPFGLKHPYNSTEFDYYYNTSTSSLTIGPMTNSNLYQYNSKEWQNEFSLNLYDYGARMFDPAIGRWGVVDPLAEKYQSWSPYNYVYNNPLKYTDPSGMEIEGDIYNLKGKHIGNDGSNDNKVYVKRTTDDYQLSTSEAKQHTDIANEAPCVSNTVNLTDATGITHEEFVQYAANVYNETFGMNAHEKQKVASAMENRLEDYNGSYKKMLDKLMFNSDNHFKKMTELDRKPNNKTDYPPGDKNDFTYGNVSTQNYRSFYNSSTTVRNTDHEMVGSIKATLIQLTTHKDIVNNKKHWSGDGIKHTFRK